MKKAASSQMYAIRCEETIMVTCVIFNVLDNAKTMKFYAREASVKTAVRVQMNASTEASS